MEVGKRLSEIAVLSISLPSFNPSHDNLERATRPTGSIPKNRTPALYNYCPRRPCGWCLVLATPHAVARWPN